jgi:hypothetical protein
MHADFNDSAIVFVPQAASASLSVAMEAEHASSSQQQSVLPLWSFSRRLSSVSGVTVCLYDLRLSCWL